MKLQPLFLHNLRNVEELYLFHNRIYESFFFPHVFP